MLNDIISSIKNYSVALQLINKLKLWKYFLIPAILGLLLGFVFITSAYSFSDNLGSYLSNLWPFEFGSSFVTGLSSWLAGFSILILGIIMYKHILMALSAPFMSPVSEKVEVYLTKNPIIKTSSKTDFAKQLTRSIRLNLNNLIKELLITLPLMLLSFIPVIGLFAVVLIFYFQAYYTGFGNIDYTLERHLNYKESKKFVKKNKGIALGNGIVFTAMLFIPAIGVILTLPIAAVASTIDTVKKLNL